MSGYRVGGRWFDSLGLAIRAAAKLGVSVMRGHQVVWSPAS